MRRFLVALSLLVLLLPILLGCTVADPVTDPVYLRTIYTYNGTDWNLVSSGNTTGVSDHSLLANLDYASSGHTGFEPAIVGGTTSQFWRGDKTWQTIAGSGDMLKATYDPNDDGVIALAQLDTSVAEVSDIAVDANLSAIAQNTLNDFPTIQSQSHTHANKAVLDNIQEAFTTALKTSYDWLVTNITVAWKTGVDNHTSNTSNPHSVTKTQVGLTNVPDLNTTDAVNNQHTHANKTTLDNIQEALTTVLKSTYDGYAALIAGKQATLVSGTNIKTINSNSILGAGDLVVGGSSAMTMMWKDTNQTINSGAGVFTDITGLTFPVTSGKMYAFHYYITFQSAATATGWKAGVNCPNGTLDFWAWSDVIANGAAGVATHTQRHNVTRDDMTLLTTTITQDVDLSIMIDGRYISTQTGTFAARFANELASNTQIVVQSGSYGWYAEH